jgi:hypothetical protein
MAVFEGDCYALGKVDRVHQMEAITDLVTWNNAFMQSRTIHKKRVILHSPSMVEIVFGSGAMEARRPVIIIDEDHLVTFSPPASLKMCHRKIASYIMPCPFGCEDYIIAGGIQVRNVNLRAV